MHNFEENGSPEKFFVTIPCKSISTRHDKGIHQTQKPSKATISIFQKNGEPFIQYFTEKSKKQGEKYRLKDNIFQCYGFIYIMILFKIKNN